MKRITEEQPPKGRSLSDKRGMDKATKTLWKCLLRRRPIKAKIVTLDNGNGHHFWEVDLGSCQIRGGYAPAHRKTARRAARRIVERINRRGIEICK